MTDFWLAIIADIHGNTWALDTVLEDIERRGIKQIVNLGDCCYGPLDPAGTAERLTQRQDILTIRGNADRMVTHPALPASPTVDYTRSQLSAAQITWLAALPATASLPSGLFLCHGTPTSDEEYLLEEVTPSGVVLRKTEEIVQLAEGSNQPVILCGHTHIPRVVALPNHRLIINPGSVGMPAYTEDEPFPYKMESGSTHARYAILSVDFDRWVVEQVMLPYSWESASRAAEANGRPDWARWIASGRG
ncbi:MAG TPA: metallophosphoesterase family protein [Ktedonobacterales bacterium]|jgi:predicted phosphodiesterase